MEQENDAPAANSSNSGTFSGEDRRKDEEVKIKREELALKRAEYRRASWSSPILIAVIGAAIAYSGQYALREQQKAQANDTKEQAKLQATRDDRQFCYRVIADTLSRDHPGSQARKELAAVVKALSLQDACNGDLREIADLFGTASDEKPAVPGPASQAPTIPASATCVKIASIRDLGWTEGHKTHFCQARGFTGVHNPFGVYNSGGYCYSGDSNECIKQIEAKVH